LPCLRSPVSLTPATERETAEKLHIADFALSKTAATSCFIWLRGQDLNL
jgi:hypothetical protein